jgi:hypothetical protein
MMKDQIVEYTWKPNRFGARDGFKTLTTFEIIEKIRCLNLLWW